MDKGPDERIIDALKNRQQIGPSLLVSRYYESLRRLAIEVYGVEDVDADAYVTEAFRRAIRAISSFRLQGPDSLRNWMATILKNIVLDEQRKTQRTDQKLPSSLFNESDLEAFDDEGRLGGVLKEVARAWIRDFEGVQIREDDRKQLIYDVMGSFEADEQNDLWAYFNGLPHKDIAEMRGATLTGTQKRVNRLVQEFFKRAGAKVGIAWRTIYENYKKQNRQGSSGRDAQGQAEDS